jgi:hypothetical protein
MSSCAGSCRATTGKDERARGIVEFLIADTLGTCLPLQALRIVFNINKQMTAR